MHFIGKHDFNQIFLPQFPVSSLLPVIVNNDLQGGFANKPGQISGLIGQLLTTDKIQKSILKFS